MAMISIFFAIVWITVYVVAMVYKMKCIPPSISETYYHGGKDYFPFVMVMCGLLSCAGMLTLSEGSDWQFLSFLTGAGMVFIGAAPMFKSGGIETIIHYASAIVMGICSQMWVAFIASPYLLAVWIFAIFWARTKQYMFWLEITAMYSLGLAMFFI